MGPDNRAEPVGVCEGGEVRVVVLREGEDGQTQDYENDWDATHGDKSY